MFAGEEFDPDFYYTSFGFSQAIENTADISFGDKTERRSLYIDQIGLEPDKKRAFITYRYAFNYFLNPMTKRIIHIVN